MKNSRFAFAVLNTAICSAAYAAGGGSWTEKTPMTTARAEVGVAALRGEIYVVGGTEGDGQNPTSWATVSTSVYDPATDRWRAAAGLPHGLSHAGVAALDAKLYAIGGFLAPVHLDPQNLAFVYDPKDDKWTAIPGLSSRRGSVAVAAVNGKLHVFGGRVSDHVIKIPTPPGTPAMEAGYGTVSTHQVYDPATRYWSEASPVPGPTRDHMAMALL